MGDDPVTRERERKAILAAMRDMKTPLDEKEHPSWRVSGDWSQVSREHPVQRDCLDEDLAPFPDDVEILEQQEGYQAPTKWQETSYPAQCPPSALVALNTTPELFAAWLTDHTKDYGWTVYRSGYRSVTFDSFKRGKPEGSIDRWHTGDIGTIQWALWKRWVTVQDGREDTSTAIVSVLPLVKFNCLQLGGGRSQVRTECYESWAWRFFWKSNVRLLTEIGEAWPQSREKIDTYLKELGQVPQGHSMAVECGDAPEQVKPGRKHGPHGGTKDRVREARELIASKECRKTEACKRVGIDTRTYDLYAWELIDEDDEPA